MKNDLGKYPQLLRALEENKIVYLFGTGISSALTGVSYSWYQWIVDGINSLQDREFAAALANKLNLDDSADHMIAVVGELLTQAKAEGTYHPWMQNSFESNPIVNNELAATLGKILMTQDVIATTNYDLLLEAATGLSTVCYEKPNVIFPMLEKKISTHVIHLHGVYDSKRKLDSIIADKAQYDAIYNNEGAQFIQNLLGTRTLIFVGCGQTTEDINIARFIRFAQDYLKLDIPYYFLCLSGAGLPALPSNFAFVEYGTEYSDLTPFLEEMVQHRIRHFMQAHPLIGRTVYWKENFHGSGMLGYHFAQQKIQFVGRVNELKQLKKFLHQDRSLLWWAVTGQGGAGKSRLALELMEQERTRWFSFFLNDSATGSDAASFTPFCDSLMVIDYVKGRERKVAAIMRQVTEQFQNSEYKLRFLFLERENDTMTGSWFDSLESALGKYDREKFYAAEHIPEDRRKEEEFPGFNPIHGFLYLEDLAPDAMVALISEVCRNNGLPDDPVRDKALMEGYGKKFETLHYRPLFVQLYVEAWMANDCQHPRYDGFTGLLEKVLQKEQERWMACVDGNLECCNALVRILVRACAGNGLSITDMPAAYQDDWNMLMAFMKNHSLPGKQRKESLETFIADICQSFHKQDQFILPLYPDIIKEYMFGYYTDEAEVIAISTELWENVGEEFSRFMFRCLTDFRDHEFFITVMENAPDGLADPNVMAARLAFLNRKILQPQDDPMKLLERIDKEYAYWRSVTVTPDANAAVAILKFGGLSLVAEQYGAWMKIEEMMQCLHEAIQVPGGDDLDLLKGLLLEERINQLSLCGYSIETAKLRQELEKIAALSTDNEVMALMVLNGMNAEMMEYLLEGDFFGAAAVLKRIESKYSDEDPEQVKAYAHFCFTMAQFGMMGKKPSYIAKAVYKLQKLHDDHPDLPAVKMHYLNARIKQIENHYSANRLSEKRKKDIEQEIAAINIEVGDDISEELSGTWAMIHLFMLSFADRTDAGPIENMLVKADELLTRYPDADMVAQAYIRMLHFLHKEVYHDKVSKVDVEKAYAYVQRFISSESIREAFFGMLAESEESSHMQKYLTHPVWKSAVHDAVMNPISTGGLGDLDYFLNRELTETEEPLPHEHKKIGRNTPCPCGSGKKYKKCCGQQ